MERFYCIFRFVFVLILALFSTAITAQSTTYCPIMDQIQVRRPDGTMTNPVSFNTYCVNVASSEFSFPAGMLATPKYEAAIAAMGAVKSFAMARTQNGTISIGTTDSDQVVSLLNGEISVPNTQYYAHLYQAAQWWSGKFIGPAGSWTAGWAFHARESNDIGPHRNGGRHGFGSNGGNGHIASSDMLMYTALGRSDYGYSHPFGLSQNDLMRLITGKDGATQLLPARFDGVDYCTRTGMAVLAMYFDDWSLFDCTTGIEIPLSDFLTPCPTVAVSELKPLQHGNMAFYRWIDPDMLVPTNITQPITGTTVGGSDVTIKYALSSSLFAGNERVYKFIAPCDERITWTLTDNTAQQKLRIFLTEYPGPFWPGTNNWTDGANDYPDNQFQSDLVAGQEYYLWVDSPSGCEGNYTITTTGCPVSGSANPPTNHVASTLYNPNLFDMSRSTLQGVTNDRTDNYSKTSAAMPWEYEYIGFDAAETATTVGAIKTSGQSNWFRIPCKYGGNAKVTLTGTAGHTLFLENATTSLSGTVTSTSTNRTMYVPTGDVLYIKVSGTVGNFTLKVKWTPAPPPCTMTASIAVSGTGPCMRTLTAAASGGTAPFTYAWSSNTYSNSAQATAYATGNYSVTITDALGCSASKTRPIIIGGTPASATALITPDDCTTALPEGRVLFATSGMGTQPVVQWSDGATTGKLRKDISAGIYSVTITGNGCTVIINDIDVRGNGCDPVSVSLHPGGCGTRYLQANITANTAVSSICWTYDQTFPATRQCISNDAVAFVSQAGSYTVYVIQGSGDTLSTSYQVNIPDNEEHRPVSITQMTTHTDMPTTYNDNTTLNNSELFGIIVSAPEANNIAYNDAWSIGSGFPGWNWSSVQFNYLPVGTNTIEILYPDNCLVTVPHTVPTVSTDTAILLYQSSSDSLVVNLTEMGLPADKHMQIYWQTLTGSDWGVIGSQYVGFNRIATIPFNPLLNHQVYAKATTDAEYTLWGSYAAVNNATTPDDMTTNRSIGTQQYPTTNEHMVQIWPNPTTGTVYVQCANAVRIDICAATGPVIHRIAVTDTTTTVSLNDLIPGTYVAHITHANGSRSTHKIIKQ